MSQQDMDLSVVREQIARVLHDAAAGRITPDETDLTPYGRMADEVVEQVLRPLLAPMHAAHYTPYVDEEHQGGYCYDFFAPMLARVAQAESLAEKRLAAREDWKARCLSAEASRRDWAAEAERLEYELESEKKRRANESLVYDRYCCWPGCFRSFNVLTGPTDNEPDRRWIQVNAASLFVFCPDHEHTGHRPQKFHWEPGWKVVQMSCECGAEGNDLVPANTDSCREWWLAHAASVRAVHPEADR